LFTRDEGTGRCDFGILKKEDEALAEAFQTEVAQPFEIGERLSKPGDLCMLFQPETAPEGVMFLCAGNFPLIDGLQFTKQFVIGWQITVSDGHSLLAKWVRYLARLARGLGKTFVMGLVSHQRRARPVSLRLVKEGTDDSWDEVVNAKQEERPARFFAEVYVDPALAFVEMAKRSGLSTAGLGLPEEESAEGPSAKGSAEGFYAAVEGLVGTSVTQRATSIDRTWANEYAEFEFIPLVADAVFPFVSVAGEVSCKPALRWAERPAEGGRNGVILETGVTVRRRGGADQEMEWRAKGEEVLTSLGWQCGECVFADDGQLCVPVMPLESGVPGRRWKGWWQELVELTWV
jgi:hypothetical protein